MTVDFSSPPSARQLAFLFVAVAIFHLLGTWWLPLIDRDEPRFAEASREMLERQDFVVPYFNNLYRFDKPPLTYWLQTASYRVFGENELAARLPSVFAAAGVAVILLLWGSRLRDALFGWKAALIFTFSLQVALHAKAAVADLLLVFFVCLAAWAGWEMLQSRKGISPASRWWWVYFGALALGFLAKGPIAWLPLIPVGWGIFRRDDERPSANGIAAVWFLLGILLTLGLVALWGIPALQRTDGQFFKIGIGRHVVGRSVATMEGHGSKGIGGYLVALPFYFVTVFLSFCPWSWFLPRLVQHGKSLWADPKLRHLIVYIALYFGVFTLVRTKLPHYTLPAFPMLALVLASELSLAQVRRFSLGMGAFLVVLSLIIFPIGARWFPSPSLAAQSASYLTPEMEFASIDFVEPSLIWSFRKYVHGFQTNVSPAKAARWMDRAGPRFYVLPTRDLNTAFPRRNPAWKLFRHRGFNLAKGQLTDLTLVLKQP